MMMDMIIAHTVWGNGKESLNLAEVFACQVVGNKSEYISTEGQGREFQMGECCIYNAVYIGLWWERVDGWKREALILCEVKWIAIDMEVELHVCEHKSCTMCWKDYFPHMNHLGIFVKNQLTQNLRYLCNLMSVPVIKMLVLTLSSGHFN